jgi:small subunit ribosomal protein S16
MLSIRLRRTGSTKRPYYRVVVADSRAWRDGRFVEVLGHYDPRRQPAVVSIDAERARYWMGKGARATETVQSLLKRAESRLVRFSDLVTIGRVIKPQGRRGEMLTESLSDRPDRFPGLRRAFVPGPGGEAVEVRVDAVRPHKRRFALKLGGVETIDEAERLRGVELRIREQDLAPLPEGSYYHHQLVGLAVVDGEGGALGSVSAVLATGGEAPVLEVAGPSGEWLLPFAADFVRRVDLEARRLVAVRPEYAGAD